MLAGVTAASGQEAVGAPPAQAQMEAPSTLEAILEDAMQMSPAWDVEALRRFYEQREYRLA